MHVNAISHVLVDRRSSAVGHSHLPSGVEICDGCSPVRPLDGDRRTVQSPGHTPVLVSPQMLVWVISAPLHGRCPGIDGVWEQNGHA